MQALEQISPQTWPLDQRRPVLWGVRGRHDDAIGVRSASGELIERIGGTLGDRRESTDAMIQRAASRCPGQALTLVYAPLRVAT